MQALASSKAAVVRGGALRSSAFRPAARRVATAAVPRAMSISVPEKFKTVAPVGDRVYVKLGAEEQTTAGGILLPSSAVSRSNEGQVVAVGKDAKLSVGDQVMFAKYAGTEVKAGDDEYVLLKEDDVIGTMGSSNTKDMKPTGSRVLIKVYQAESKSRGGVMLGSNKGQQTIGTIVAVGPGKEDAPMTLKVGQDVMYPSYAGMELEADDDKYVVLNDSEVLAVLS